MKKELKAFDLWEQIILRYLTIIRIPSTVTRIAIQTQMSGITCKKKLKSLELKGKVKPVKVGTRTKYQINLQEKR